MLSAILSFCLIDCATSPPDVPVFEHLAQFLGTDPVTGHMVLRPSPACMEAIQEAECGHGVFIISKKEIFVGEAEITHFNKKPWSQLRRESVYLPAVESYAPVASYLINSCKQSNCNDQITKFKIRMDELKSIGKLVGPKLNQGANQ